MSTENFIVEIGTEELPPMQIEALVNSFSKSLQTQLSDACFEFTKVKTFATPRRLAVYFKELTNEQPAQLIEKRGPAIEAAFDENNEPTKAAEGFAKSCGVTMQDLCKLETEKGTWLYFQSKIPGKKIEEVMPAFVEQALKQLPVKKYMRWGDGELSFVRPVHWILMVYGKTLIKANILGIDTSNYTYGHRVHSPKPIKVSSAGVYLQKLERDGKVIANFDMRKQTIKDMILNIATRENATAVVDPDLLTLVTGLVEHPVALLARFDQAFLRVPKECLISAMQDHQKCFALLDQDGNLLPKFILISNLASTDPQTVTRGNELVMHARLADAAFHYDSDLQLTLESRVEKLKNVIYQQKLGSIFDKATRIESIAKQIAPKLNADPKATIRAAKLCKADLVTNMVYEFPELQGTMGYYYALHDNENRDVALAIAEHYKPKFSQDTLPETPAGLAIAIADRIDSLVALFGIGKIPTGEKDPYGLRRQSLAILRILIEKEIDIDLQDIIAIAVNNFGDSIKDPTDALLNFFFDRLKAWYTANDTSINVFVAVKAKNPTNPFDFDKRIKAVMNFQALPAAMSLAAANKRVHNILEKLEDVVDKTAIDVNLFVTSEEEALYNELQKKEKEIVPLLTAGDYSAILKSLATLQVPIDNFFTNVMVMVDDLPLRNNRLQMLQGLRRLFLQVADVSLL